MYRLVHTPESSDWGVCVMEESRIWEMHTTQVYSTVVIGHGYSLGMLQLTDGGSGRAP